MKTKISEMSSSELQDATAFWLAAFEDALDRTDTISAADLFLKDSHWRDVLAFTWHLQTMSGISDIEATLKQTLHSVRPSGFQVAPERTAPRQVFRAGIESIEAIFEFNTLMGRGSGVLRLIPDSDAGGAMRAWTFLTSLEELGGHEERLSESRAGGDAFKREWGGDNWQDLRNKACAYDDHEPAVLVVGGGQAGLGITARLTHLGVDTLIIDSHERIGDNWRERYHSLVLHNEVFVNHMPYMPFPKTWPVYIPKDLLATWFEAYVAVLELNYWSATTLESGYYDEYTGVWHITLCQNDGSIRVVRPRHVVMATGVSAIPAWPDDLHGLKDFSGEVIHSGSYEDGNAWSGKKALVLGTGNSGHDVAHDLCASGADVTMIQRSSTHIVGLAEAQKPYALYSEGPPIEDCDLLAVSLPFPVLRQGYQLMTKAAAEVDKEILDGLGARGFRLNAGVDDCGFQMSYLQRGGGYYFNVGASDLIVEGKIGLLQYSEINNFTPDGVKLDNGDTLSADLLVLATGFKNMQETTRSLLGDAIADRIGPVWGFDAGGELRNMWKRTAQPGLWFAAGSLAQCRIYSRYLALQIKACEVGLITAKRD
jgi:cation diffusion facilitator CzcD-associated flavoprotein CzcO